MHNSQTGTKHVARVVQAKKVKIFKEPKPFNPYRAAAERLHNHPRLEAYMTAFEEQRRRDELEFSETM